jgi:hypothetical protein
MYESATHHCNHYHRRTTRPVVVQTKLNDKNDSSWKSDRKSSYFVLKTLFRSTVDNKIIAKPKGTPKGSEHAGQVSV